MSNKNEFPRGNKKGKKINQQQTAIDVYHDEIKGSAKSKTQEKNVLEWLKANGAASRRMICEGLKKTKGLIIETPSMSRTVFNLVKKGLLINSHKDDCKSKGSKRKVMYVDLTDRLQPDS